MKKRIRIPTNHRDELLAIVGGQISGQAWILLIEEIRDGLSKIYRMQVLANLKREIEKYE